MVLRLCVICKLIRIQYKHIHLYSITLECISKQPLNTLIMIELKLLTIKPTSMDYNMINLEGPAWVLSDLQSAKESPRSSVPYYSIIRM